MKICWDTLEKLVYCQASCTFKNNYHVKHTYRESCDVCGDSYLTRTTKPSKFCCSSCAKKGSNHPFFGKKFSKEHRNKISDGLKGHSVSDEVRLKLSKAHKGKGYNKSGKFAKNYRGGVTKGNLPLYDTYADRLSISNDVRRSKSKPTLLEATCKKCGKWFVPKRTSVCYRINCVMLDYTYGESHLYCSDECKITCEVYGQILYPKDFKIEEVFTPYELSIWRDEVLRRTDYKCEYCDNTATDAHHILPKKLHPAAALDPDNGLACCERCHYKYGHRGECSSSSLSMRVCR